MLRLCVVLSLFALAACSGGGGSNAGSAGTYVPNPIALSRLQEPVSGQSLPVRYTLVDLGTFIPLRINKYGEIVGNIQSAVAAVWKNGVVHQLPPYPQTDTSVAVDINDYGTVIGNALNRNPNAPQFFYAISWSASGAQTLYSAGFSETSGVAINDSGRAIGTGDGRYVIDLRTGQVLDNGLADSENDLGSVLYDSGGTVCEMNLSHQRTCFPKAPGAVKPVSGVDINNHNDAIANDPVLCRPYESCLYRGVYYHAGLETVIYAPSGSNTVRISGLNDNGWIVGAYGLNVEGIPFVYVNGKMTKLSSYGFALNSADDVNDAGEIVGTYKGGGHGYLLRPVY